MFKVSELLEILHESALRLDGSYEIHVVDDMTKRDDPETLPEQVLEEVEHE